ncbi:MAG: redoxin domain-containing protein [Pirellulaceae bacterium]
MRARCSLVAILLMASGATGMADSRAAGAPAVGARVESFTLHDSRGALWSLDDVRDQKVVVVVFLGTECPLVQLYAERLNTLAAKYAGQHVAFVAVNANQQDSLSEINRFAKEHGIRFPILKDSANRVADQLGASRTPEVFVLDAERRLRYHGRIDDQYTYGIQRTKVEHAYLQDAIDGLLAGRELPTVQTEVVGCLIGRLLDANESSEVTYARQVSRILNRRCVACHRPGEIGPFDLTSYDETVGWAEMIAEVVRERRMPPWHANPEFGHFSNDVRLTDEEVDVLLRWVRAGAPLGDKSELPPPPQFVEGWQIGQPDLVIPMADTPFEVPASGEVKYQYFVVDPGFHEDKWVRAAECRPGNRAVVHHIIVATGNRKQLASRLNDEVVSDWLAATAPGARPMILPPGQAKRIPAGAKLVFQMHYTPNGKAQQDLSSIGLIFADPKDVQHEVITQKAANPRFRIPPGDSNYRIDAQYKFKKESYLLALFPHMHLRGKSFRYTAVFPDGREQVLLDVPRYDFNWQNSYVLDPPLRMPVGARIQCVAHYDNSAGNWANPDPSATVGWGDQTWEEMMIGYFNIMPVQELRHGPAAADTRIQQFEDRVRAGRLPPAAELQDVAAPAVASEQEWQRFATALQSVVPQLDRVCWTTLADEKLTVQRAAQEKSFWRAAPAGTRVPADGMLLAQHVSASQPVVHAHLEGMTAPDVRLLSRWFGSSVHIPARLGDQQGLVSFWSTEPAAFSPACVDYLAEVVRRMR